MYSDSIAQFGVFEFWIIVSLFMIILSFGIPSISIYFFALSALCISVLVKYFDINFYYQFSILSILSLGWCIILIWINKRNQNTHKRKNLSYYQDLIGQHVKVTSKQIVHFELGTVFWSGTVFNAKMHSANDIATLNEIVIVKKVEGNVLICSKSN